MLILIITGLKELPGGLRGGLELLLRILRIAAMLRYATLRYATLRYATLRYAMLR